MKCLPSSVLLGAIHIGCGGSAVVQELAPEDAGAIQDVSTSDSRADTRDAFLDATAEPDAEEELYCHVTDVPNADVEITSPVGRFVGAAVGFGIFGGECGGRHIVIAEDVANLEDIVEASTTSGQGLEGKNALSLSPRTYDSTTDSYVGTGPVYVEHWNGGERAGGEVGEITITEDVEPKPRDHPIGEPKLTGRFVIEAEGWSGSGSFDASYCANLSIFCP